MKTLFLISLFCMGIVQFSCSQDNNLPVTKGRELVWEDEFNYTNRDELLKVWESQNGPNGHILCSRWQENIEVGIGTVRLVNRKESRGGQDWTSGSMWTRKDFQYGYFECRYRYASETGTNNSFWLMTRSSASDPVNGKRFEIDINEGHYPNEVNTNIHNWSDVSVNSEGKKTHPSFHKSFQFDQLDFSKDFHTFGLEWNEQELIYYLDGKEIRRAKNEFCYSAVPILLSLAIIPWAGEVTDAIDGTYMEIDYVKVFNK